MIRETTRQMDNEQLAAALAEHLFLTPQPAKPPLREDASLHRGMEAIERGDIWFAVLMDMDRNPVWKCRLDGIDWEAAGVVLEKMQRIDRSSLVEVERFLKFSSFIGDKIETILLTLTPRHICECALEAHLQVEEFFNPKTESNGNEQ
jgi:hypothetical protein